MIVEWFVQFVGGIIGFFLGLLPEDPDGLGLPDFGPLLGLAQGVDAVLPIHEFLAVIAIVLLVNGALFLFALIRQVWRFVPVIGGG